MDQVNLQRNFDGYLHTPLLWHNAEIYRLHQLVLGESKILNFTDKSTANLRLGKLVEQFVFHQLKEDSSCAVLAENIQIQEGNRTIGELDAILKTEHGPVHLEIIYKFYLYDPNAGSTEISHWIGPNRKDSLLQKLDKLKEKQLPLLYHPKTQSLLESLGLSTSEIKQRVLFKAQLFLPMTSKNNVFSHLHSACVRGFYMKMNNLDLFKTGQFYIPEKIHWLMDVHENVKWMHHDDFLIEVRRWADKKLAPLCWLKQHGKYSKFFVVWW